MASKAPVIIGVKICEVCMHRKRIDAILSSSSCFPQPHILVMRGLHATMPYLHQTRHLQRSVEQRRHLQRSIPVPSLGWSSDDDHPNITSHTTQFPQSKIVNASIAAIVSHPNMVELCDAYGGQSLPLVPPVALNQLLPLVIAMADDGNLSRTVFPRMGLYCLL